jgi:hypothetical protein
VEKKSFKGERKRKIKEETIREKIYERNKVK